MTTTLPPGPDAPAVEQTLAIMRSPTEFLGSARERFGDVFTVQLLGSPPFVVLADPAAIREVFTGPPSVMLAGEANAVLGPLVGPRSLLLLDREEHLEERRRLLPPFHGARMHGYEEIMERAALRAIEEWPVGQPFALLPSMQEITLEVIMRAVLGVETGARYEELAKRLRRVLAPGVATMGDLRAVDDLVFDEIAERRDAPGDDVLSMLIEAGLTDEELRDEVVTLLVAGHETTATALAWTFERLLRHPEALARCREDTAYLDAAIKETLRVRPVISSVGRVLSEPYDVAGWRLPPGTRVMPSIVLTHANERVHPDHATFRPERFLGPDAPSTYEWIPFGGGPRRCIGASFALFEMRVVVRTVLAHTTLEAVDPDHDEAMQRMNIVLSPVHGARVVRRA